MFNFQAPVEKPQSLPTRISVPADPKRGVEITIEKYEYVPTTGNMKEKAVLTLVDANGVPHYHDFLLPTSDKQIAFRLTEFQHFHTEVKSNLETKLNFSSYQEACDYYLNPLVGSKGRIKVVYTSNEVVYDPKDEKLAGKTLEEIKRMRKPYAKSGSFPYFYGESNNKDFTLVEKGDKYDDFVDYKIIAKQADNEDGFSISTSDEPEF